MFKLINSKQIALFIASLITSVGLLSASSVYSHSSNVTTPGNVCQPANLAQALARGMSWNQFRVFNPSDTQNFFVTCGISRSADDNTPSVFGYVVAHFAVGHNGVDEVACIWRSNSFDVSDDNIATTVVAITGNVGIPVGDTPPTSNFNNSFNLADQFNEASGDRAWTVTCNLPPKTGINMFGVASD